MKIWNMRLGFLFLDVVVEDDGDEELVSLSWCRVGEIPIGFDDIDLVSRLRR